MNKLKFHIVGLTHSDVKNHEVEYAKHWAKPSVWCPTTIMSAT